MHIIPNSEQPNRGGRFYQSNLYRKFKDIFRILLDKDFALGGLYKTDTYVSVDPYIENRIKEMMDSPVHSFTPLLGDTGIGKTHLILYCIENYYSMSFDRDKANIMSVPGKKDTYDILAYYPHERTSRQMIKDSKGLLTARVLSICDEISKHFDGTQWEFNYNESEIEYFINSTKSEINYYPHEAKSFSSALSKLKYFLTKKNLPIRSFVLIYDDMESLDPEDQSIFVHQQLKFYECFQHSDNFNSKLRFFFCMRFSTYHSISKKDNFNTHRISEELKLCNPPPMSEIFEKRFKYIVDYFDILSNVKKVDEWERARDIMFLLSERIEKLGDTILYDLNNMNVSEALDTFYKVLTNYTWTQRNKNQYASFRIEEEDYSINSENIFKVIFMEESEIYYSGNNSINTNPFYEGGGRIVYDLFSLYVLLYANIKYNRFINSRNHPDLLFGIEEIKEMFGYMFMITTQDISSLIDKIIRHFISIDLIKTNDIVKETSYSGLDTRCYLKARGHTIFEQFCRRSILFEIFRDSFSLNDAIYKTEVSKELSNQALFEEFFKYINEIWKIEKPLFKLILNDIDKRELYEMKFGENLISEHLIYALKMSMDNYFRGNANQQEYIALISKIDDINSEIAYLKNN
ncbi:MAG: hypothetical protein LBC73_08010 [Oscillospiraceae bacterium]|jgi:hypothetical protein|nr:hypothetical protein [Oscillospiraceae bacterium]